MSKLNSFIWIPGPLITSRILPFNTQRHPLLYQVRPPLPIFTNKIYPSVWTSPIQSTVQAPGCVSLPPWNLFFLPSSLPQLFSDQDFMSILHNLAFTYFLIFFTNCFLNKPWSSLPNWRVLENQNSIFHFSIHTNEMINNPAFSWLHKFYIITENQYIGLSQHIHFLINYVGIKTIFLNQEACLGFL